MLILSVGVSADTTNSNGVGDDTNSNGVGDTTNSNGLGDDTPNDYDPKVDPNFYKDGTPKSTSKAGFDPSNLNKNPFSSGSEGVPKLSLLGIVYWLAGLMNQLVYLIIGASLVCFLYGIFKLSFVDGQKPEAREQARKFMFWGIVSLFVMMSVWGLVNILKLSLFGPGDLIIPRLK